MTSTELSSALRLLLVTDDSLVDGNDLLAGCIAAVNGGVTSVQVRFSEVRDRALLSLARELVRALPVPVFVNNRLDIALAAGAAGVHLGNDDLPPALARQIAPPGFVVGASVGSAEEALRGRDADYWGVGPLHSSRTKPDAGEPLALDGISRIVQLAEVRPVVAIGGVTPSDVEGLVDLGCAGVAVASGILAAEDIKSAAASYLRTERILRRCSP